MESVRGFHDGHIMHSSTALRILYLPAGLKRKLRVSGLNCICLFGEKPLALPSQRHRERSSLLLSDSK